MLGTASCSLSCSSGLPSSLPHEQSSDKNMKLMALRESIQSSPSLLRRMESIEVYMLYTDRILPDPHTHIHTHSLSLFLSFSFFLFYSSFCSVLSFASHFFFLFFFYARIYITCARLLRPHQWNSELYSFTQNRCDHLTPDRSGFLDGVEF